uniref:permease n=1 Tax=Roseburia sp. TaxID=2049040 RepID=UPI003FF137F1
MKLLQSVLLLTGFFMVAVPKAATRRESREDADAVKKTRTRGVWLFVAAVIWVITEQLL